MEKTHYFLGWPVSESVKGSLMPVQDQVKACGCHNHYPDQRDLHMTAVFLGSLKEEQLNHIHTYLSNEIPSIPGFSVTLTGLGTFGRIEQPRVVIYKVSAGERFYLHREDLFRFLSRLDLSLDQKPFTPHITLAKKWNSLNGRHFELRDLPHKQDMLMPVGTINVYKVQPDKLPRYEIVYQYDYLT